MNIIKAEFPAPFPPDPLIAVEDDLAELKRRITAAIVDTLQAGNGLSPELAAIIEARDALIARLSRLEEETYGRRQEQNRKPGPRPD